MPGAARMDGLPLAEVLRIHQICEQFEADWRAGRGPRIEDRLGAVTDPKAAAALFRELVVLEVELAEEASQPPRRADYDARFPDHRALLDGLFPDQEPDDDPTPVVERKPPSSALPAPAPSSGERVGDYEILDEISRGGMGIVYRARHAELARVVALKTIRSGTFATDSEVQRFLREAEAVAALDHPHIVPIYECGRSGPHLYYSMKLVEGGTLAEHQARLRNDPRGVARLLVPLARALHYAHERGFVHRDLKPANVLLDDRDHPYLTDFGLAKRISAGADLTQSGALLGTPGYMAPEQAEGRPGRITAATDVYGLGAILYELLTGRPPFVAETVMETVVQVLEREPLPPSLLRRGIPRDLERICLKCLEKRPEDRYASAAELGDDLERFHHGEPVAAGRSGPWVALRRWLRRRPALAVRLVGLGLIFFLTQVNFLVYWRRNGVANAPQHVAVSAVLALWMLGSLVFSWLGRRRGWLERARLGWVAADILFLTTALSVLHGADSAFVVAYPLLIAASGLWARVKLVVATTVLACAGYLGLLLATGMSETAQPNIVVASLAITGLAVGYQVKRFWALSTFYEQRVPAD